MNCENCNERPAQIHLTQIVDNTVTTLHLCEQCAAAKGVQTIPSTGKLPLTDFVASVGKGAAGALPPGGRSGTCPGCGASLKDFRETGRLGCARCYETFSTELRDLLRRLHGSAVHVGEAYVPPNAEPGDRSAAVSDLRDQLKRAVEAENFELAAELRDRIQVLET